MIHELRITLFSNFYCIQLRRNHVKFYREIALIEIVPVCQVAHWQTSAFVSLWQISKSAQEQGSTSTSQQANEGQISAQQVPEDIFSYYEQMDKDEEEEEETQTVSFEIRQAIICFKFF